MVANIEVINKILKGKNLNITEIRQQIIGLLLQPGIALTQKEIEELLLERLELVDRVTVYRNIKMLNDKRVIHQIPVSANTVKYKLAGQHKASNHPHFQCELCNRLVCMPQMQLQTELLPSGFVMKTSNLIIEGVCADCNEGG